MTSGFVCVNLHHNLQDLKFNGLIYVKLKVLTQKWKELAHILSKFGYNFNVSVLIAEYLCKLYVCVCVCVCDCERERESACMCVCVCGSCCLPSKQ